MLYKYGICYKIIADTGFCRTKKNETIKLCGRLFSKFLKTYTSPSATFSQRLMGEEVSGRAGERFIYHF